MAKKQDLRVIYRHTQTNKIDYGGDCSPAKSKVTEGPFGEWPKCLNSNKTSFLFGFGYEKKKCRCGSHILFRVSIPNLKTVVVADEFKGAW